MDGTGKMLADFCSAFSGNVRPMVISYPEDRILSYAQLADFVARRLPRNEPFVLLGESFSGPVAVEIAATRPPGLTGVVLCCSFAGNPRSLLAPLRGLVPILPSPARLAGFIAPLAFGRFSTKRLRALLATSLKEVSPEVLRARMRAVLDVDHSDRLKHIGVPVLYLQAKEDRLVPESAMRRIRSALPGLRLAALHGPHFLLQAMPAESAKIICDFASATTSMQDKPG